MKVIELFGGIGAFTQAVKRLKIDFEVVDYVEIDKYAVKSYNAINGTNYEPQDITEWDKDIKADFIMHGSPCQDFSVAGLGKGASEDGETRSSLMYETIRIVDKVRPKYVLWENVKNVLSKKHRHNFDNYLSKMKELGYHNYYQVLNAKDYGVPQNRERIFVLSCLEDIDYKFPEKQELTIRLKDILEDEVEEKYYISSDKVEKLIKQIVEKQGGNRMPKIIECEKIGYFPYPNSDKCHQSNTVYSPNGLCPTIDTMAGGNREPKIVEVHRLGNVNPSGKGQNGSVVSDQGLARTVTVEKGEGQKILEVCKINENRHSSTMNSVLDTNGICSCLDTMGGGNREPKVVQVLPILTPDRLEKRQNGRRCKDDGEPMFTLTGQDRHGVVIVTIPRGNNIGSVNEICPTITKNAWEQNNFLIDNDCYLVSIRKLTPKECWRLMGFTNDVFELAEKVNSNSQLYKQAGNSIVVDVLEKILKEYLR